MGKGASRLEIITQQNELLKEQNELLREQNELLRQKPSTDGGVGGMKFLSRTLTATKCAAVFSSQATEKIMERATQSDKRIRPYLQET